MRDYKMKWKCYGRKQNLFQHSIALITNSAQTDHYKTFKLFSPNSVYKVSHIRSLHKKDVLAAKPE